MTLNSRRKICFPERFSVEVRTFAGRSSVQLSTNFWFVVQVGGSREAFVLLLQPDLFSKLSVEFRQSLLDLLFLVMKGNVYNIIRFQSSGDGRGSVETFALVPLLLNLLDKSTKQNESTTILKRIVHLIGIAGTAGMCTNDLKTFLHYLRTPSELSVSLLQALKIMLGQDHITSEVRLKKASPAAIFDFGGSGSGLSTHLTTFPFSREYQYCTWFRVENFESEPATLGTLQRAFNPNDKVTQHVMTWQNSAQKGMDIFIEQRTLYIAISTSGRDPTFVRLQDCQLQRGVWYHLSVRHSKPRLALFASDELTIHIDDQLVFQDNVRFPSLGSALDVQFSFGTNFDGQMAPIYLFSECLPPNVVKMVAGMDAGKPVEGIDNGFNLAVVDLLPALTSSDRKVYPVLPKMAVCLHPTRCLRGYALDIHSGRHAKFGANTQSWVIANARDLLNSMGGLSCILPMFPRLLIENESYRSAAPPSAQSSPTKTEVVAVRQNSPVKPAGGGFFTDDAIMSGCYGAGPTGLGDTLADLREDTLNNDGPLDYTVVRLLRQEREEYLGEGSVGLLLSIIAKCIVAHRLHQQELINAGGIEMIEYALTCTPQEIMQGEGERCVFSLRELQKSASDSPILERRITKSLLCNFAIWHRASFQLVSSLMSVILEAIKVRPTLFVTLMGVKPVLDSLEFFTAVDESADYYNYDGNEARPMLSHSNSTELAKITVDTKEVSPFPTPKAFESPIERYDDNGSPGAACPPFTPNGAVTSSTSATSPSAAALYPKLVARHRRNSSSGSANAPLTLSSVNEDEECDFSQPNTAKSTVPFVGFNDSDKDKVVTPIPPKTPNSAKKLNMKRLKSFKLALTDVIQDAADEEESSQGSAKPRRGSFRLLRKHDAIAEEDGDIAAALNDSSEHSSLYNAGREGQSGKASHQVSNYTMDGTVVESMAAMQSDAENPRSRAGSSLSISLTMAPQTPEQRKHLRDCLEAMVVALVLHGGTDKEVNPILDFMVMCKDRVVLNEIAQILLYLIVERGSKFMLTIINACNGPEEFASFVLLYLVHQPYEELRCTGIRILTHFYLRIDQIPPSVTNLTLKQRRKGSIITRAIPTIGQLNSQGLQRLQACGGMALLCEIAGNHSKSSSELTYSALLELLLTKPGSKCQVTVHYTELFESVGVPGAPITSPTAAAGARRSSTLSTGTAASVSSASKGYAGQRVVFAADYLSPDQVHDEGVDMLNSVALPIFFELLPKLPVRVQGQIYSDLLALLKHSEGNCHAFVANSSWQLCMFGLVAQLVSQAEGTTPGKVVNSHSLLTELERWSGYVATESPFTGAPGAKPKRRSSSANPPGELLRAWRHSNGQMINNSSYSYQSEVKPVEPSKTSARFSMSVPAGSVPPSPAASTIAPATTGTAGEPTEKDKDLWFAIGMKIYATLLLHAIDSRNGWREIDRSISQSYESDVGYSVAQTVLSHVLNELTFSMRGKYKELQRLAKSTNSGENQEATDKIENFLCLMLTTSQLALVDQRCAVSGIKNFHLCKLRVHYFTEIQKDHLRDSRGGKEVDLTKPGAEAEIGPSEMRQMLERTEIQLASKLTLVGDIAPGAFASLKFDAEGARVSPAGDASPSDVEDENKYHKYLNFYHSWHDLSADEVPSSTGAPVTPATPALIKSTEELLHPLERNHDLARGKLVLVLQTLRFFDVVFWPIDGAAVIRNAEMMRFNKEDKAANLDSMGTNSSANKLSASAKAKAAAQAHPMTLFSSVMRMCLFILHELSPMAHVAVINMKRMRMLVNSIDKIPQYKTPTHDWLLVAVMHTTLHLQRLALSLEPVYEMLGIHETILVPTLGPWADSYDEFDRMDPKDSSAFDAVAENADLLNKLQRYFDSSPGRNLIRNIRASLLLLADAFELHHDKLSVTLEERTFRSLWVFVEHFKVDSLIADPNSVTRSASADVSLPSRSNSIAPTADGTGDIFETPSPKPSRAPSLSRFASRRAESTDNTGDDVSEVSLQQSETGSTQGDRPTSGNSTTPVPMEAGEDSFHGSDLLLVMKWLRFPYFRLNPFRSLGVIRAVDALDYLEGRSVNRFARETEILKQALEEQRDLAVKSVEEMTELKELSLAVFDMMSNRNDSRVAAQESAENLKLKNVAARWHDCIQTFEEDWSPWRVDEPPAEVEEVGVCRYELSKHRDLYLRRMASTRLAQPTYHKDAAYLEGKMKDQYQYENSTLDAANMRAVVPSTQSGRAVLPFKSRTANDKSGATSSWGDDDEDAVAEEATSASSIAGGIANLLYWNEKRPHWTYMFHWAPDERLLFESEAMQIKLDQIVAGASSTRPHTIYLVRYLPPFAFVGSVILTNKSLYFHSKKNMGGLASKVQQQPFIDKCWHLERIVEAYGRRYLLQNCAIELFFIDAAELFLAFKSLSELQRFFRVLRRQNLPLLVTPKSLNPKYAFSNSQWTDLWRRRQISNFEYLMRLNIMAGRSFNDITQYPVFPWVLADFKSSTIDLTNPQVFRRLDLPIGALNPTRLEEFLERYQTFDDDTVPKFMYGSHYSSAGVVLHYMVRQEPFTTLAINLQGGRFDCPDRVFFELSRTWDNCNESMSDVKEMIPELFCCPEALLNTNNLPLGELQEGGKVDDVRLPPWAKDAFDFIRVNRAALESDYVSENLPQWIDLVFGFKQTGPNAVAAKNVFYYLTYENAINIESIEDSLQREAAKVSAYSTYYECWRMC
jgi:hypothetical protein